MFYAVIWVGLCILVLGLTKYITSLWLKRVQNRMRVDSQEVVELKEVLDEKQREVDDLEERNRELEKKESILTTIVANLELTLSKKPPAPTEEPSRQ